MPTEAPHQGAKRARLTFDQFQTHCKTYLNRRDSLQSTTSIKDSASLSWLTYAQGWTYLAPLHPDSSAFYSTACLHRSFSVLSPSIPSASDQDSDLELESPDLDKDPTEPSQPSAEIGQVVTITQSISWSPIWQLPVLHFHANYPSGQPLSIEQLKEANVVFRAGTLPNQAQEVVGGGVSVGDHPRSGLPSFYLHPCETEGALSTLLPVQGGEKGGEEGRVGEKGEEEGWEYIAAFVSLCASAVEMRATKPRRCGSSQLIPTQ